MTNDLIIRPQVPAPRPEVSLPGLIFGTKPRVILRRSTIMLVTAVVLYFGALGGWLHRIGSDVGFMPPHPVVGGSHAVNMAEALILRETVAHRWAANDPVFFPTVTWDNQQNFQRGLMRAISRFTMELETQIGRMRGSSAIDGDLQRAAGLLQFPTDVWIFDFQQSFLPVQPADTQFAAAARALRSYNLRVADRTAVFETRADALALTLVRLADELGSRAAVVDVHTARDGFIIDFVADDIFYFNKGLSYGSYMLLRELGRDHQELLVAIGGYRIWNQMLESIRQAAQLHPTVVLNSSGATSFFANHLHMQGFYMKRAILQKDEVVRVLLGQR